MDVIIEANTSTLYAQMWRAENYSEKFFKWNFYIPQKYDVKIKSDSLRMLDFVQSYADFHIFDVIS